MSQQQQQLQPVSPRLDSFLKYINFKLITEDELNLAMDYIDNNLNATSTNGYGYWYDMYSYCIKNFIVLRQTKNVFCNKGCSSVHYNKVF